MKSLAVALLGGTALLGVSSAVFAADLPVKAPPPVTPVYTAPVFSWTGFYLGANVGYGWASDNATGFSSDLNGVIGGGQIGYNWQTGPLVIGIEADIQGSGQRHSDTGVVAGVGTVTVDRKIPWFTTLRGRIGYSTGPVLIYFTGGGAWLDYELSTTSGGTTVSDKTTSTAWTVGGGLEWMFLPKWSAKVEYLYLDGRDTSVTLGSTTFTGRARDNIIRAGLNYHF